jgi:hypothetical protein
MSIQATLLRPLKLIWRWDGVVSSKAIKSFFNKIPREARSPGGGESSVRIGTEVITSDHRASCGEVLDVISSE